MNELRKFIKRSTPGWLSVAIGAGWQALEHYDKIEKILPLPPWCIALAGAVWILAAKPRGANETYSCSKANEVVMFRERTTTVEREYVVRRES